MDILTTKQASKIWGISERRIAILCKAGRIDGAYKIGTSWVFPANSEKPSDKRITSGKYIGVPRKRNTKRD